MLIAPYGAWPSPITAADVAAGQHPVEGARPVGDEVWWLEQRPVEQGRLAVRRRLSDGKVEDVLPPPWNARSRVHEYGGGAWTVTRDGVLLFTEFTDQRIYRLDEPGGTPVPITAEAHESGGSRYGDLQMVGDEVWAIRETHQGGAIARDLAAVRVNGSDAVRSVVNGSHFLAGARLSPDGHWLAWIAWNHPQMPWDGTELRIGEVDSHGFCRRWQTVMGSSTESVLQPEWGSNNELYAISDRTGFWNLYRVTLPGSEIVPLCVRREDFAGPLWRLGAVNYVVLDNRRLLTVRTYGVDKLGILDPATGELRDLDLEDHTSVILSAVVGRQAYLTTSGARTPPGARVLDLASGSVTDVRLATERLPPQEFLPVAEHRTFTGSGDREVHAIVYPPRNPKVTAPEGELPPYVAWVHGGPTSQARPHLSPAIAYFTSRGIGIVDVNYGGSSGYGRAYRERLHGQWGVVDVEDTVAAVNGLVDQGVADPKRLAIRGASAGGLTVLTAITRNDTFACGVSYYGVADLLKLAMETHDFESHYLDGLIGPLPQFRALYEQRAPINNLHALSCPVLLLQGLDDPVVPPAQAQLLRDALVAKGIAHAYRTYPGESHGFRQAATIMGAIESELSFYGQTLGFIPPAVEPIIVWRPDRCESKTVDA